MNIFAYFVNWAIYGRNFQPQEIPADKLDFLLYAFANVRPETGEVYLSDCWSDLEKHYPEDSWNETGDNAYGCVKQIFKLKTENRNMKVLLSIGGWSYSANFAPMVGDPGKREKFAQSAISIMKDVGFDGLDIDWEYPQNDQEAQDFVSLLKMTRERLDDYASLNGLSKEKLYLTIAAPCGKRDYEKLRILEMNRYVSFWNLMAYDYSGSWDQKAGHISNLYGDGINTDQAVEAYINAGVPASKLVLGSPLYGRSFLETDGPGTPFSGVGQGSWENGVFDYKVLPLEGAEEHFDEKSCASWSYDPKKRMMVSYDTPECTRYKAKYVKSHQLGGVMFWETSGDHPVNNPNSIIGTTSQEFEETIPSKSSERNILGYPRSKYNNIREGRIGKPLDYEKE